MVLPPSLPVLKVTRLLKAAAPVGAKVTTTLVQPKPGIVAGPADKKLKGELPMANCQLAMDNAAPPRLVRTKLASAWAPTRTKPKSRRPGETPSCAGVRPEPVTELVELPPLLVKTTRLLKVPASAGLKLTTTLVEPRPGTVKVDC